MDSGYFLLELHEELADQILGVSERGVTGLGVNKGFLFFFGSFCRAYGSGKRRRHGFRCPHTPLVIFAQYSQLS